MKISIVTPTYNEVSNIEKLYNEIKNQFTKIKYDYEHIIIDNNSNDGTIEKLRQLASSDKNLKVILNTKNFGHIKSPFHGLLQSSGDATILMASDFQDPIDMIPKYIEEWKKGKKIVLGEKIKSEENFMKFFFRKMFYKFLNYISDLKLTINTTGSGIFDRSVIEKLKKVQDPYPYFRGLISEIGYEISTIKFHQPKRLSGKTKNNFFTLYDIGMLGIVKHSRKPLRFMILIGFIIGLISLATGLFYLIYKLLFWNSFSLGIAPVVVGRFFVSSVQIILLGLVGEYIGVILIHTRKKALINLIG